MPVHPCLPQYGLPLKSHLISSPSLNIISCCSNYIREDIMLSRNAYINLKKAIILWTGIKRILRNTVIMWIFDLHVFSWIPMYIMFDARDDLGRHFSRRWNCQIWKWWKSILGQTRANKHWIFCVLFSNAPFSVGRVFFQEDCSDNMHDQLLDLDKEFLKSRLYIATRKWSSFVNLVEKFIITNGRSEKLGYP